MAAGCSQVFFTVIFSNARRILVCAKRKIYFYKMNDLKLMMVLVGCRPAGRHTEQHDVFFGIGGAVKDLIAGIVNFWPAAKNTIHLDAWREVTSVDGYAVDVSLFDSAKPVSGARLFFINLGGYKRNEFEEFHYKMIVAATGKAEAISKAKATAFYRHTGFKGAPSHVDDKYAVDVDDVFEIKDILPTEIKNKYSITLTPQAGLPDDELHLGYMPLHKL